MRFLLRRRWVISIFSGCFVLYSHIPNSQVYFSSSINLFFFVPLFWDRTYCFVIVWRYIFPCRLGQIYAWLSVFRLDTIRRKNFFCYTSVISVEHLFENLYSFIPLKYCMLQGEKMTVLCKKMLLSHAEIDFYWSSKI